MLSLRSKNSIKKLSEFVLSVNSITNNKRSHYLKLPLIFNDLLLNDVIYFYGYLLGDGCISKKKID